jgi:hypothetical protein
MIKPLSFDKSDPRWQEYWIQPRGFINGGKMAKRSLRIVTKLANRPKKGPRDIIYQVPTLTHSPRSRDRVLASLCAPQSYGRSKRTLQADS